eukprot:1843559-Pleurochrysis_carterae.AAC.3
MASEAVARTPDERFTNLPDFPYAPHYVEVPSAVGILRIHYLDEGPRDASECVVCFHGQPTWSFLYRKMIPHLVAAGFRVLAPDFVGFGRSDKPVEREQYTYAAHVAWMTAWADAVFDTDGQKYTFLGQDWGGLIGLRVVTAKPDRFSRIVVANSGLPAGPVPAALLGPPLRAGYAAMGVPSIDEVVSAFGKPTKPNPCTLLRMLLLRQPPPREQMIPFFWWIKHFECASPLSPAAAVAGLGNVGNVGGDGAVDPDALRAYAAPFPDNEEKYLAGARRFPTIVPIFSDGGIASGKCASACKSKARATESSAKVPVAIRAQREMTDPKRSTSISAHN